MSGNASSWQAIVLHADDDVAVALRDVSRGERIAVRRSSAVFELEVIEPVALGHKIALHDIAAGAQIRKYGECIGEATATIGRGAHVHVHNMRSRRASPAR